MRKHLNSLRFTIKVPVNPSKQIKCRTSNLLGDNLEVGHDPLCNQEFVEKELNIKQKTKENLRSKLKLTVPLTIH